MTWELLIPVIVKYGLPWALDLWQIVTKHPVPTEQAWLELRALSQKTMDDYIAEAKAKAN
jgi:hypothetical protein